MKRLFNAPELTSRLNQHRKTDFQLPDQIRNAAESMFGENLEDVRIHIGPEPGMVKAQAFAFGNDIYFTEGVYRPDSIDGRRILGHELTHVVQQRQGRVQGTESSVLYDAELELEADRMGERLATAMSKQGPTASVSVAQPAKRSQEMPRRVVQCLMKIETFETLTEARGKRNRITAVEDVLKDFHATRRQKPTNLAQLLQKVRGVFAACTTYMSARPKSNRVGGVIRLQRQAGFEEAVIATLASAAAAADVGEKWRYVSQAKEYYIDIAGRPEMTDAIGIEQLVADAVTAYKLLDEGGDASGAMMQSDIAVLEKIGGYASTPQALRTVITECMGAKGGVTLDYGSMTTASLKKTAGGSYTLNHNADQGQGSKERVGSLLHELTHLLISRTFNNTAMLIDIKATATDTEILAVTGTRTRFLSALMADIASNQELFNFQRSDSVPASQGGWLHGALAHKAKYPLMDAKYLAGFLSKGAITQEEHDRWEKLAKKGSSLQMIEYTPCINQMSLWCHLVGFNPNNPVYQKLLGACQTEIGRRRGI